MTKEPKDTDEELRALDAIISILQTMKFDQQWRILNYVLIRLWGRNWALGRPSTDAK